VSGLYRLVYILFLSLVATNAGAVEFSSGARQVGLLELYTSEGCSSCPPAEAYLNGLKDDERLWKDIVPVAFHVDYWDYLGWQDRYARPEHRVRQEAYAAINKQNTIYTPAFFLNGRPWRRGWLEREPATSTLQSGVLRVQYQQGRISANFRSGSTTAAGLQLHVAILGLGLTSDIAAGENRGRHSRHDFVVLQLLSAGSTDGQWQMKIRRGDLLAAEQYALAAWVTGNDEPQPLQAVGGYLPVLD